MKRVSPVRLFQHALEGFVQSTAKTKSLEQILRIFHKTIRLFSLSQKKAAIHLENTIETLGVVQGIHLIQELVCPDRRGLYFLQRESWPRCVGRGFLFGYNLLLNLKLAEKLELLNLPSVTRVAIGRCSLLRLATSSSYLLYRLTVITEGIRQGRLWQVAISASKICTVACALLLRLSSAQAPLLEFALTAVSLLTDVGNLAKMEKWI
jgi:hypothetical protein